MYVYGIASFVERKSCAQPSHLITPPISVINMHVGVQQNILFEPSTTNMHTPHDSHIHTSQCSPDIVQYIYLFQAHSSGMKSQVIKFIYCTAPLSFGRQPFTYNPRTLLAFTILYSRYISNQKFIYLISKVNMA